MALRQAKIVTITSVKGGSGKTTLALSLAGELSLQKKSVLLLNLDLYESALAMHTGSDADRNLFTLIDDLKNNRYTSEVDYVSKYDEYISVLPAPKDPRLASKITNKYIQIVLSKLKTRYDFIIIDTNHTMDSINLMVLDNSDEIFYVIEKDPIQIKNMKTIVSIFGDIEKENYHIVLNEATRKTKGPLPRRFQSCGEFSCHRASCPKARQPEPCRFRALCRSRQRNRRGRCPPSPAGFPKVFS